MIPSNRFKFLDQETNVAISDFINANSSDILNRLRPLILTVTPQLSALLNGLGFPNLEQELGNLTNEALGGLTRFGKDALSSITDVVGLSKGDLETFGQDLFSGINGGLSAFKSLTDTAQMAIATGASLYNEANMFIESGGQFIKGLGGDLQSVYGVTELLNKVTNGNFDPHIVDQFSLERMVGGLSYASFKTGLPGAFTSLAETINHPDVINNALVMLTGRMAREGNMNALLEMANNALSQNVMYYIPNISGQIVSGYSIPSETKELGLPNCYGDLNRSLDTFSTGWDSGYNGTPAVHHAAIDNNDYHKVVSASVNSHVPSIPVEGYTPPPLQRDQITKAVIDYSKTQPRQIEDSLDNLIYPGMKSLF